MDGGGFGLHNSMLRANFHAICLIINIRLIGYFRIFFYYVNKHVFYIGNGLLDYIY